ncbi:AMP-binding protein [Ramlibacter sp.]|uniref:AMP-dependent synthetase/ligase n=1 Tax=Ramlibacter sp. TaxID=1917967 RepID=UPI0017C4A02A|nr:AMP-binding protein [Ramlibacter sp.]MBA2672950.1 AMP-binding protein [Ramlibacter sp.]
MSATFPQLLLAHARRLPTRDAMRFKEYGIWQVFSWSEVAEMVMQMTLGLQASGVGANDHVVIIGSNRPRLYAVMLAVQAVGAVPVPLYQDAATAQYIGPITSAGVRHAVVEDQEMVDKLLEAREQCPGLARIWFDDPRGLRHYGQPGLAPLDDLFALGRQAAEADGAAARFEAMVAAGSPQVPAAVFYTSGTTGKPKGVVHTHAGLIDRAKVGAAFDRLTDREDVFAYLPPAWIGQNIFSYAQWLVCGYIVNCPESAGTIAIDMAEIGPTYYFAPPPVFESMLTRVMTRMEDAPAVSRWLFHRSLALARKVKAPNRAPSSVPLPTRALYRLCDWIIYGPLRNSLGLSRIRVAYTAGEAIGPDLFAFYRAIGINLKQLYGSTETGVFVCIQPDDQVSAESVGVPLEGVEIDISDAGEVMVRSPGILREYYRDPDATAEVKTADGWYHTGDAGHVDAAGHLRIVDRVKNLGRLKGGANDGALFAPKYVENKLKFFPYIKEAVAFGDGRDMVGAFINIDIEAVGNWAERRNLPYAGYADLATKPAVIELVRICIEKANEELAAEGYMGACQIHRFIVLHKELDSDDGEMTLSKKVRREFVFGKYAPLIEAVYEGRESQFFETDAKLRDGRISKTSAVLPICPARTFPLLALAA